ncbi:MAG TPA: hypothetical protein VM370_05015 [Candidatus Thermoplasmatota archaeon]|nr:hypothetical protein [Candidatus Thermoplasmatota archaeon]
MVHRWLAAVFGLVAAASAFAPWHVYRIVGPPGFPEAGTSGPLGWAVVALGLIAATGAFLPRAQWPAHAGILLVACISLAQRGVTDPTSVLLASNIPQVPAWGIWLCAGAGVAGLAAATFEPPPKERPPWTHAELVGYVGAPLAVALATLAPWSSGMGAQQFLSQNAPHPFAFRGADGPIGLQIAALGVWGALVALSAAGSRRRRAPAAIAMGVAALLLAGVWGSGKVEGFTFFEVEGWRPEWGLLAATMAAILGAVLALASALARRRAARA